MKEPPVLLPEEARLAVLAQLALLDTPPDYRLDRLVTLAGDIFQCPMAVVSLVDKDRQWFKAKHGVDGSETAREHAFCATTIQGTEPLVVLDASEDPRFMNNPFVTGEPRIRFYAGMPLIVSGAAIGTICVFDSRARDRVTGAEADILRQLGELAVGRIGLLAPDSAAAPSK